MVVNTLNNEKEVSKFMLKAVDLDHEVRTLHPTVDSKQELQEWVIPPKRHAAYEFMWNSLIYFGVVANTAMWLYV